MMLNWFTKIFGIRKKNQRKKVQVDIPFEHLQNEPRPKGQGNITESHKPAPEDP